MLNPDTHSGARTQNIRIPPKQVFVISQTPMAQAFFPHYCAFALVQTHWENGQKQIAGPGSGKG